MQLAVCGVLWQTYSSLSPTNQIIHDAIEAYKEQKTAEAILQEFRNRPALKVEDNEAVRRRIGKGMQELASFALGNHVKDYELLLVSHSNSLKHIICEEYDEVGFPTNIEPFQNAEIREYLLDLDQPFSSEKLLKDFDLEQELRLRFP